MCVERQTGHDYDHPMLLNVFIGCIDRVCQSV